jgi:osmotically-inducible protein OsmY
MGRHHGKRFMGRLWLALMLSISGGLAACQVTTEQAASQTMQDASVTAAVQTQLTADRTTNFTRVDVDTEQGIVRLSGVVQTPEQKARAEELAKQVDGVKRVRNTLRVQTAQP